MADLTEEINCPVCSDTRLASSFLASKVSGQRICIKCWKSEVAKVEAGEIVSTTETASTPTATANADVAAQVELPAEGEATCPKCSEEVDVEKFVTSRVDRRKICWRCYFKEMKERIGGGAAGKETKAPEAAAAIVASDAGGQETGATYVRAQTVRLLPVARPTGEQDVDRRGFLGWIVLGWAGFVAACAQSAVAVGRFMFPNVSFDPPSTFKIGFPEEYEVGLVETKFTRRGIWIIRDEEGIYVLSTVCTHLGCTPSWLDNEQKFKCPCHGSGFRKSGINFEGPAPRPLERFRVVLAEDGQIQVDTSKKFLQEKGQWGDPESFLQV